MTEKEILGAIAAIMGVISYSPYFIGLWRKSLRPHVFSWVIWGVLQLTGAAIQWQAGAGAGAWLATITGFMCFAIAAFSLPKGDTYITRSDWIAFIAASFAIPIWFLTDGLWAIVWVALIDTIGYYPSVRKAWLNPWDDSSLSFYISALKWIPAILAMNQINATTVTYPAVLIAINFSFASYLLWRRGVLGKSSIASP